MEIVPGKLLVLDNIFMTKNIYFSISHKIFPMLIIRVTFQLVSIMKLNCFPKYS